MTSDAPRNSGRHLPGDALPPPQRRATPARKGARCGAGAGSPRLQRPHPGHGGHGTPANRPRGRAAGGGTASDTRRPSQRWQATPPRGGPPPPLRHAAPTRHAGRGDGTGPPHPHARAHSIWVVDPDGPPGGRATGGGTAPGTRRPSQRWRAIPPGTTPDNPAERGPPRACKQRGQGWAPTPAHPRPRQEWRRTNSPPRGRTVGGGGAPDRRRPSQRTPCPQHMGSGPRQPPGGGQPEGGERPASDAPRNGTATDRGGGST